MTKHFSCLLKMLYKDFCFIFVRYFKHGNSFFVFDKYKPTRILLYVAVNVYPDARLVILINFYWSAEKSCNVIDIDEKTKVIFKIMVLRRVYRAFQKNLFFHLYKNLEMSIASTDFLTLRKSA